MNTLSIVIIKFLISTLILNYINLIKLNEIIESQNSEYINITRNVQMEGQQLLLGLV